MPRPRLHKNNAAKQRAYRERLRASMARNKGVLDRLADAAEVPVQTGPTPGHSALVDRVLAVDVQARQREQ